MGDSRPGDDDLIMVGSFNLGVDDLVRVAPANVVTSGAGSLVMDDGTLSGDLWDHVLVLDIDASHEARAGAVVVDVRDEMGGAAGYGSAVGDRLPLSLTLDVTGPDDDVEVEPDVPECDEPCPDPDA